jgi:hypothetical protein
MDPSPPRRRRPCALFLLLLEDVVHTPTIFNFTFFMLMTPFRELMTVLIRWDANENSFESNNIFHFSFYCFS